MYDIFNCRDATSGLQIVSDTEWGEDATLDIVLLYVVFGSAAVTVDQSCYLLNSDDFLVVNSGCPYRTEKGQPDAILCRIDIPLHLLQGMAAQGGVRFDANSVKNPAMNHKLVRDTIKNLLVAVSSEQKAIEFRYFELGFRLLDELTAHYALDADEAVVGERRIDRITGYIRSLYSTRLSLTDVGEHFYMSPAYFSRYFKAETGETFVSYLDSIRLEQALADLRHSERTVTDIASTHGFASVAALNKSFRARYGQTPSAFRRSYRAQHPQGEAEREQRNALRRLRELDLKPAAGLVFKEVCADIAHKRARRLDPCSIINIGAAHHLMTPSVQQQVLKMTRVLRLESLRVSCLFDPDMVYFENGEAYLNFDNVDQVVRFLLENQIGALIALETPRLGDYELDSLDDEGFSAYTRMFCRLLHTFLAHTVNQFLLAKTLGLQFELGNSTGLSIERYAQLFGAVRSTFDTLSHRFVLGGPCFSADKLTPELATGLDQAAVPFDFISMESYAVGENVTVDELLDNHALKRDVDHIKACIADTPYAELPFYVTKWNFSRDEHFYLNDTCYKGAYMARSIQSVIDDVDMLAYGCLSDITENRKISYRLLDGLPGLLSNQGIYKPAFFSLKFFHHIQEYILACDRGHIVTADQDGNIVILCNNCCTIDPAVYARRKSLRLNDIGKLFKEQNCSYRFKIRGLAHGTYQIRSFIVNRENASLLDQWREWGFLTALAKSDLDQLHTEMRPKQLMQEATVLDGTLTVDIEMEPNQISMIRCDCVAL